MYEVHYVYSSYGEMYRRQENFGRNVNLSVRAMVLSTFYHNTSMMAQAQRVTVPENCDEYKRLWEICCISVTKVTRTDGDSLSNTSYRVV